jgi:hypothetical protein
LRQTSQSPAPQHALVPVASSSAPVAAEGNPSPRLFGRTWLADAENHNFIDGLPSTLTTNERSTLVGFCKYLEKVEVRSGGERVPNMTVFNSIASCAEKTRLAKAAKKSSSTWRMLSSVVWPLHKAGVDVRITKRNPAAVAATTHVLRYRHLPVSLHTTARLLHESDEVTAGHRGLFLRFFEFLKSKHQTQAADAYTEWRGMTPQERADKLSDLDGLDRPIFFATGMRVAVEATERWLAPRLAELGWPSASAGSGS